MTPNDVVDIIQVILNDIEGLSMSVHTGLSVDAYAYLCGSVVSLKSNRYKVIISHRDDRWFVITDNRDVTKSALERNWFFDSLTKGYNAIVDSYNDIILRLEDIHHESINNLTHGVIDYSPHSLFG